MEKARDSIISETLYLFFNKIMIVKIHFDMFYGLKKMSPIYTLKSLFSALRNNM